MSTETTRVERLLSRLRELEAECLQLAEITLPAEKLGALATFETRLEQLQLAHSQSWFGDHSSTYFENLQPAPAGRSFDVEWGFVPGFQGSHNPGWRIYSRDELRDFVFQDIGEGILQEVNKLAEEHTRRFSIVRDQILDVLEALADQRNSKALVRYTSRVENDLKPYGRVDFVNARIKSAPRMTRDSEEIAKGQSVPAHVQWLAAVRAFSISKGTAHEAADVLRNVIEAMTLTDQREAISRPSPRKIFIGHGRSEHWRALKDFVCDRLGLQYEEFSRISAAGISTQERLSDMLNQCGFAFLVLAAEDLHGDGSLHARENVIHEAGLFQGRFGWRRAIIILEEDCQEFSNIYGLGQIRYRGTIDTCFEEVRRVLEREEILSK